MRTNNKLYPHMSLRQIPGIELGTQWWEMTALTTVPSLLPKETGMAEQGCYISVQQMTFAVTQCVLLLA